VSCKIRSAMDNVLNKTQGSFESSLAEMSLADVIGDLRS